jgi:hypothetical protein
MAYSVNTAIVPVKKGDTVNKEVSLAEAARRKKAAKARGRLEKRRIADGDRGFGYASFHYANGNVATIRATNKSIRTMLLPTPKAAKGKDITVTTGAKGGVRGDKRGGATKPIQVSFGKTNRKSKKDGKNHLVQSWKELSVPTDATLTDILHWVSHWKKQPAIVRYGTQDVVLDFDRARKGAGAVA